MKCNIYVIIAVLFLFSSIALASDDQIWIPFGGDDELAIGVFGDVESGTFFNGFLGGPGGGGGGGPGAGDTGAKKEDILPDGLYKLTFEFNVEEAHVLLTDINGNIIYNDLLSSGNYIAVAPGEYTWVITADNHVEQEGFVKVDKNTTVSISLFSIFTIILLILVTLIVLGNVTSKGKLRIRRRLR